MFSREAAIPRRFDEGCDQIRRELAKAAAAGQPVPCGVVALSFNKLMGRSVLVFQQKEAYFDKIAVVIDKLVPTWRARRGIKLAGVLCHVLLPAFDDENGRFVYMHFSAPVQISYVLVRPSETEPARLLGAICETPGDRLLFFPGCRGRNLDRHFVTKPRLKHRDLQNSIDHFTFETRTLRGHLTEVGSSGKRKVIAGFPGQRPEVTPKLYAWFGLTLRSPKLLDAVPRFLGFTTPCPRSDVTRRMAIFEKVWASRQTPELVIPYPSATEFLQVNFYVDLDPDRPISQITTFIPNGPPELRYPITLPAKLEPSLQGIPVRNDSALVYIDASVWTGETVRQVGFGC